MEFIDRTIGPDLLEKFRKYPVLAITGARQTGKSTLLKKLFPDLPYVNLESHAHLSLAKSDPVGFVRRYMDGAIFDEAQNSPEIFPEIQVIADEVGRNGMFIVSGSQHFLLLEKITQSLAGRVYISHLYPFTQAELGSLGRTTTEERIFTGGYPRIHKENLETKDWFDSYVQTFIERDIHSLRNISDLNQFRLFVKMCAGRSGQILDLTSLGNDCGISANTAKAWLSLLETGFVVFRLFPYHKNFNKRLIKSPKLYFWDSGLLCFLLGINHHSDLIHHGNRGAIFETYIVSELKKVISNNRQTYELYFWRDKSAEIDVIIDKGSSGLSAVEIKSGATYTSDFKKNLDYFQRISGLDNLERSIFYTGTESQKVGTDLTLLGEASSIQRVDNLLFAS
jgi:uncharacterized protein